MSDLDLDDHQGPEAVEPTPPRSQGTRRSAAPGVWFAIALISLLASLILLPADSIGVHWVGYVLVVFGTLVGLALFRRAAYRRQNDSGVAPSRGILRFALIVVCAGLLVAAGHAWSLAWYYA